MRLSAELLGLAEQRPNALGERELVLRGMAIPTIEHLGVTRDAFDAMDFTDNRLTRLENFPRLNRLSNLLLSGNLIETVDAQNLSKNVGKLTSLDLSHNRVSSLHQVVNLGKSFPSLEFLSLVGNPVTRKQHYRLYTIRQIPSLKALDMQRIKQSERDQADRLAQSAAGAALESDVAVEASKTFVPGQGRSAQESFSTSFTADQKEQIRQLVAAAKTPAEIAQIEESVQRGIFPAALLASLPPATLPPPPPPPLQEEAEGEGRKRAAEDETETKGGRPKRKSKRAKK